MSKLVLASSSPYRRELLSRLQLPFETASPDIDERPLPDESATELVARLALSKTQALAERYPGRTIIGSDQVAALGQRILTKPGNFSTAVEQLSACSGRSIIFYTSLCVLQTQSATASTAVVETEVRFRQLSQAQIEYYVTAEQPYDCAGSFKCEGLGIALFEHIRTDDPTALIGLPLIALTRMLTEAGLDPLAPVSTDHK